MSVIVAQYKKLLNIDLEGMRRKAILSSKSELIMLQKGQIRKGKDKNTTPFKAYVNKEYADYKSTLSSYLAALPTPDLYFTGNFQEGIFLRIDGDKVIFDSKDDKAPKLKKKYKPFGLQKKNIEIVKTPITNKYTANVYKEIST